MTIDELLQVARTNILFALNVAPEVATPYAMIAQAAAQTAQGMIMHAQAQDIAANNERAELQALWRK